MLDIVKLERRWLKYKIKKMLPYILLGILITLLIFTIPMILSYSTSTAVHAPLKESDVNTKTPISLPAKQEENRMLLEPSMQFLQSMSIPSPSTNSVNTAPMSVPHSKPIIPQPHIEAAVLPPIVKPLQAPVQKGKLTSIKRDDAAFDIHELEERFKNNSNPNLGLYIARYHYDHGNYTESYNYALKTNAINSTMDESWLIFAKSLVKLGKEDQAKKTLQLYIANSNSHSAKNYLDTLSKEPSK